MTKVFSFLSFLFIFSARMLSLGVVTFSFFKKKSFLSHFRFSGPEVILKFYRPVAVWKF